MFQIGDVICHPMHGAGVIEDIVSRTGKTFYLAKMIHGSMTVMIPCETAEAIGVRHIISAAEAEELIAAFYEIPYVFNENWSKRYRENLGKIKSGDLLKLSEVVKTLYLHDKEKSLSTGERKLFNTAKNILFSELSLSLGKSMSEIEHILFDNKK